MPISSIAASPQPALGGKTATTDQAISLATPVRTPAPTRTPDPTVTPQGVTFDPSTNTYSGPGSEDFTARRNANIESSTKADDASALLMDTKSMNDSITAQFASEIQAQKAANASSDARTLALNSKEGTTDSGTGVAAVETEQAKGRAALQNINDKQAAATTAALGKADALRASQQRAEQAQQQNDDKSYQALKVANQKAASDTLSSFANGNVDLEKLKTTDPNSYNAIKNELGLSDLEMTAKYNSLKTTKNQTKYQYKVTGDTVTAYGVDANGNLVTHEETVPGLSQGKFTVKETKDGSLYKVDSTTGEITKLGGASAPKPAETTYSKNQETDAKNWLALQSGFDSAKDYAAFDSDPTFKAWAIQQATAAKPSKTKTSAATPGNPFATPSPGTSPK